MKLAGIFAPMTTPFDYNGDVYIAKIRHNAGKWNRTRLSGYLVCGSSGESVMLSREEKVKVWETVREAAAADKILIAGTSAESVHEAVELANLAAAMGYHAALVQTPHYYKNNFRSSETQTLYYRAVADGANIPLLIYNFPQVTGIDLTCETILCLASHPNIAGVKESSGDSEKIRRLADQAPDGFEILTGSSPAPQNSFQAGASGVITALADAAPYYCISIHEAIRTREDAAAADLQARAAAALAAVTTRHGIPGLKYAMDVNGYYGGPPRLPLIPPSATAKREIEAAFHDVKG